MEAKDQKFVDLWEAKRQHKWRYILRVGVLGWGLPVGLIAYFLMVVIGTRDFEYADLIIQIFVFSGGGMLYGYSQFHASEKRFYKLTQA
jgi:hypothetical protein